MKYQPDFPARFGSLLHVQGWMQEFFAWHNEQHHHVGLAMFTPAEVFFGRVAHVAPVRQAALDAAYAKHPERFVHGPPKVLLPPTEVSINPGPPPTPAPDHPEPAKTSPKASHRPVDHASRVPSRATKRKGSGGPLRAAAGREAAEASTGCRDLARSEHDGTVVASTGPSVCTQLPTQEVPH